MSSYGPYGQPPGPGQGQPQGQPFGRPQPGPYGSKPPYGTQPPPGWGQPPAPVWGPQSSAAPPPDRPSLRPTALPVVTLEIVPGRSVAAVLGPVVGVVARARELPPQARTGSMTQSYAAMLLTSRQDAVDQVVAMAQAAGADAVVGLRFDSSEITQSLSEVTAYGTAVTLTPGQDDQAPVDADGGVGSAATSSPATPVSANPWRPVGGRAPGPRADPARPDPARPDPAR
ncbi:MAG: heavy metal-binding domain-containing protein [Propionibacteriaceae bacterium]